MTTTPHKDDSQLDTLFSKHARWNYSTGKQGSSDEQHYYLLRDIENLKAAIQALIAKAVHEARVDRSTEILAFAKRVQLNGQYVPIETGLIPWLEAELASLQASKETP